MWGARKQMVPVRRPKHTVRRKKPDHSSFSTYIYKVLKQVHPDTGISNRAMAVMNDLNKDIFRRILAEAVNLCEVNKKLTMTSREVQTAVRLILPGYGVIHWNSNGVVWLVSPLRCEFSSSLDFNSRLFLP